MLDRYLRDERFRILMSVRLSCDTPGGLNTMPPLIQSHDGLKRLPPTGSQTVNKHIATWCLSLCVSHPVFTKKGRM